MANLSSQNDVLEQPTTDFHVIGVGASAGGLGALKGFLTQLPKNFEQAIILIPHLSPNHKSHMGELLTKYTPLPIIEVYEPTEILPGHIYLLTPKTILRIEGTRLVPQSRPKDLLGNHIIDQFFYSLAHAFQQRAMGIILSGTGTDGSAGAAIIDSFGGTVLVQKPEDAQFDGMPMATILTNVARHILPAGELASKIGELLSKKESNETVLRAQKADALHIDAILLQLQAVSGVDHLGYKRSTITRRIAKRMGEIDQKELEDYLQLLKNDDKEARWLSNDLLIGVTNFFRDPLVWEHLEQKSLSRMVKNAKNGDVLRMWCIGCSTGQEAFSLALSTLQAIKHAEKNITLKIFASDLSKERIAKASRAIYHNSEKEHIPKKYHGYLQPVDNAHFQFVKSVRDVLVFNHHNSLSGPHISNMNLVLCRNMLIYLQEPMQKKMFDVFRFALNAGGYLVLGLSEGLHSNTFFTDDNRKLKIFKNLSKMPFYISKNFFEYKKPPIEPKNNIQQPLRTTETNNYDFLPNFLNDTLIEELDVAAIYITQQGQILRASGGFRRFLELPPTGFSNNIFDLTPLAFQATLREAISTALEKGEKVKIEDINLPSMGPSEAVKILITPYQSEFLPSNSELLLVFLPSNNSATKAIKIKHKEGTERDTLIIRLQNDLKKANDELAILKNEVDVSSEELQTTNEELMVSNEELQSANEELQSVNEELHAVNDELSHKLNDLAVANDDIDNLLNGTLIDVLLVDKESRVRRFTPNIRNHFNMMENSTGVSISDFKHYFKGSANDLSAQCKKVIATGENEQKELQNHNGEWFLRRITPFLSSAQKIEGAIITFVNITELKSLYQSNQELERFAYVASHDLQEPLRNIMGFIGLFKKEYDHCFDDNALTYLNFINGAAERMGVLIKDILAYSRIGVRDVDQPVDLAEVVENVIGDLQRQIEEKKAIVKMGQMPIVNGHPLEFYSLFLNLIGNALKFVSDEVRPKIMVTSKKTAGFYEFAVADNGTGIAKEHQGKVFEIFKRFHDSGDYKGTGIGLAHCKKIVELHGGSIWVQSKVGQGSTFYFTIKA